MKYKLVIAEKPSVAQSIAKVIGATERKDGYLATPNRADSAADGGDFESVSYLVSWCYGHLIELAAPETYDPKYVKWRKDDLPIFPDPFQYQVTDSTKKQFQILKKLMERNDVVSIVEATDSGREGELIFRLVYHQANCCKPFERLWISSMEDSAIRDGFAHLKPSNEYDALYKAALCRERADWIVGINATRLFSTLYGQTLNVGRVMTPTLGMIVSRETEIERFRPEPFYTIQLSLAGILMTGERLKDRTEAEQKLAEVQAAGAATIQTLRTTDKTEKPPLLYDLTSLQRDANSYYGFTAQQTLDYTQSLYEKKLVTYPRTDSRYLTDEMCESTQHLARQLQGKFGLTQPLPMYTERLLNSKKVSDHHAIIPTENVGGTDFAELPSGEQKILSLIAARLFSAMGDPAEITEYDLAVTCGGQTFTAKSRVQTKAGWKGIQEWILGSKTCLEAEDNEDNSDAHTLQEILAADPTLLSEGKTLPATQFQLKEGRTTPKKRFTESSLLSAMERAGADETPAEAERKGLGTPATRAGIIEKLVRIGFVERKGDRKTKYLVPTHKGIALITVMPEVIQSPGMTAEWEQKLVQVEQKTFSSEDFMREIQEMLTQLIGTYELVKDAEILMHPTGSKYEPIGKCPACGADVVEKSKGFFCSNRDCRFALWKDNRFLDSLSKKMNKQIAADLLQHGRCRLKKCRSIKTGKTYDTTLVLSVNEKGQAGFALDFENRKK
jgi:DNA topoisomerase III